MIGNYPELTILMPLQESLQSKKKVSMKWMLCWGKIIDLLLFFLFMDPQWSHRDFHENPSMHPKEATASDCSSPLPSEYLLQHFSRLYTISRVGFTLHQGASWRGGFFRRRRPETNLSPINAMNVVLFFMWRERP